MMISCRMHEAYDDFKNIANTLSCTPINIFRLSLLIISCRVTTRLIFHEETNNIFGQQRKSKKCTKVISINTFKFK